jgi:molecular chaperone DnaK (HSP70)
MLELNKKTIGLDLGTDKCCITYQDSIGRPFVITDDKNYKISSIIGLLNNGLLVGNDLSKDNIYDIPIVTNLKRLIGHKSSDTEAQQIAKYNNWTLEDDLLNDDLIICINQQNQTHKYNLNYLMCILLNKIKSLIISNIGENFNVIITIPANFNEGQKNKILSYCLQCNIECKRLIYEPCAAALTYINYFNIDKSFKQDKTDCVKLNDVKINDDEYNELTELSDNNLKRIIVFDFGAGTLDLAIVTCNSIVDEDDVNNIEWMAKIESHVGDNNLGGIDIDMVLSEYLKNKHPRFSELLLAKSESSKFIVEKIKIKLSKLYEVNKNLNVNLIERYYDLALIIDINEYFDLLNKYFKQRIIKLLDDLHKTNVGKQDIDTILLIGGSCYNPWIKKLIEQYYEKQINDFKLNVSDHLETYNLDIKDIGVSLGATCINKKINKNGNVLILTESLPLSIGIDTVNNIMCKIIPKGSLIPITVKKYFTTSVDNQKMFEVKLYQGECDDVRENFFLGSFVINDLEPEPQGKLVIIIIISVTTDGLITIEGKIKNTEKYNQKIIINRYNINIDEKLVNKNVLQYELNDHVFNSIIKKYYSLVTMLNKLQYNLLDNITNKTEPEAVIYIFSMFWEDLNIIYKLMTQSNKLKTNVSQLKKFIEYVNSKINLNIQIPIVELVDDKLIGNKLDILIKFIEKNLSHIVSAYQIKSESDTQAVDNTIIHNTYDTLDDINLKQINSIYNSTEILTLRERELIYQIENLIKQHKNQYSNINTDTEIDTKSDIMYLKEINDLSMMIVNEIDSFPIPDYNKLLMLDIIDKYDTYIKKLIEIQNTDQNIQFNAKTHLETIQKLCMNISIINDNDKVEYLHNKLSEIDISQIELYDTQNKLNEVVNEINL